MINREKIEARKHLRFIRLLMIGSGLLLGSALFRSVALADLPAGEKAIGVFDDDNFVSRDTFSIGDEAVIRLTVRGGEGKDRKKPDIMLVMDRSGSMSWGWDGRYDYSPPFKMDSAKTALNAFVNQADANYDRIGLASYSSSATLNQVLTNNFVIVRQKIGYLNPVGGTSIGAGLKKANEHLEGNTRPGSPRYVVLATDGQQNTYPTVFDDNILNNSVALGIVVYTVGIGNDVNGADDMICPPCAAHGVHNGRQYLEDIADRTGGRYLFAPNEDKLIEIYERIKEEIEFNWDVSILDTLSSPYFSDISIEKVTDGDGSGADHELSVSGNTLSGGLGIFPAGEERVIYLKARVNGGDGLGPWTVYVDDEESENKVIYRDLYGNVISEPDIENIEVTIRSPLTAKFQGRFFNDLNLNGVKDTDEPFIGEAGTPAMPSGEYQVEYSAEGDIWHDASGSPTDSCGAPSGYSTDLIAPGSDYLLRLTFSPDVSWSVSKGYFVEDQSTDCTAGLACSDSLCSSSEAGANSRTYTVSGITVGDSETLEFWFGIIPPGKIQGLFFEDANENGVKDATEGFIDPSPGGFSVQYYDGTDWFLSMNAPSNSCGASQGYATPQIVHGTGLYSIKLSFTGVDWKPTKGYYVDDAVDVCLGTAKCGTGDSTRLCQDPPPESYPDLREYQVGGITVLAGQTVNLWLGVRQRSLGCDISGPDTLPPGDGDGTTRIDAGLFTAGALDVEAGDEYIWSGWSAVDGAVDCGIFHGDPHPNGNNGTLEDETTVNPPITAIRNAIYWESTTVPATCTLSVAIERVGVAGSSTCYKEVGAAYYAWVQVQDGDVYSGYLQGSNTDEDSISVSVPYFADNLTPGGFERLFLSDTTDTNGVPFEPGDVRGGIPIAMELVTASDGHSERLSERPWKIESYNYALDWPEEIILKVRHEIASGSEQTFAGGFKVHREDFLDTDDTTNYGYVFSSYPKVVIVDNILTVGANAEGRGDTIFGVFLANQIEFTTRVSGDPVFINGALYANRRFNLEGRELNDNRDPAIVVEFNPEYFIDPIPLLSRYEYSWIEVAPR